MSRQTTSRVPDAVFLFYSWGALLFDVVIVVSVLFRLWHDDWSPRLTTAAGRAWFVFGRFLRLQRTSPKHAH